MNTLTQKMRTTTICLITVAAIALPGISQAGWFSSSKPVKSVSHIAHRTTGSVRHAATSTAGSIKDKVTDISSKVNEMAAQFAESRPLADAMKNGKMMSHLTEMVHYINDYQKDYEDFNNRGADEMRDDIRRLVSSVNGVISTLGMDNKVADQMQRAADIIEKVPATFLYPLAKSGLSEKLKATRDRFLQMKDDVTLIATLPREKDVLLYPESYKADLCPLVNDYHTKVQLAVLSARIKQDKYAVDLMSKLIPDDLTVNIEVVGGGGLTISKFPVQYLFIAMNTVLDVIEMRIDTYTSIGGAMCTSN